jgi:hypothetical protein
LCQRRVSLVPKQIAYNKEMYQQQLGDQWKFYKTIEIIVKAVLAIAALWLCVSCTMSMSISKNNMNSTQSTEQSQATSVDSTKVDVDYK